MKIAVISDLHTISSNDPWTLIRKRRIYFAEGWPYFSKINKLIHEEAPDLVVCLGDMVDFYSEENRDFAISLLNELPCPWVSVPGNHDFESYYEGAEKLESLSAVDGRDAALIGWGKKGIELGNRYIDAGDTGLILLDSAVSGVPEGTKEWLEEIKGRHPRQLLFTHVPLDTPEVRDYILSLSPNRNLVKYVQSKSPWVTDALGITGDNSVNKSGDTGSMSACSDAGLIPESYVSHVFTGHLHFPGDLLVDRTQMHMLGMSVKDMRFDDHTASACIVEIGKDIHVRRISLPID